MLPFSPSVIVKGALYGGPEDRNNNKKKTFIALKF